MTYMTSSVYHRAHFSNKTSVFHDDDMDVCSNDRVATIVHGSNAHAPHVQNEIEQSITHIDPVVENSGITHNNEPIVQMNVQTIDADVYANLWWSDCTRPRRRYVYVGVCVVLTIIVLVPILA